MSETLSVADVLRKALEAFGPNGENWGKKGEGHCVLTALGAACGVGSSFSHADVFHRVRDTAFDINPVGIIKWNDAPERTFAEVKALFEKAIEKAGGQ